MTLRKSILLLIGLGMIAALAACGGSSHKNTTPTIAATSGGSQSATVGTAFANPLVATVTLNGSPSSGASVTFTAPSSGASCTFANSTNTETDTANASGVATSSVCTANTTAGAYNVTASTTGATAAASFSLTNTTAVATLADGTYVFSLAGQNLITGYLFNTAGAFTVSGGTITGGEQDFVDYAILTANDSITSGSVTGPDATGDFTITLNPADPNVGNNGVETLSAVMATSGTAGFVSEFDGFASGIGELRLQSLPGGNGLQAYAFW